MNIFEKLFRKKLTGNEFVEKFICDSSNRHVQLELHYNKRIVLQLENLKYSPYILKAIPNKSDLFKDGYVVHFTLLNEMIPKGKYYKNILINDKILNLISFKNDKNRKTTFHHFFKFETPAIEIAEYIRLLIEKVYGPPISNQKFIFYLRYFKPAPGSG